jgi:hypothetical protein
MALAGSASGQMAVEQWTVGATPSIHKGGLIVEPATARGARRTPEEADGPYLVRADLSSLPTGTAVLSARLLAARAPIEGVDDRAMVDVEVLSLTAPFDAGRSVSVGPPLKLLGPWHDSFDVSEVVRAWMKDRASNFGLYVKTFPGMLPQKTVLEISFAGKSQNLPPQVTGLKAVHRAGQTFLTWQDSFKPFSDGPVKFAQLRSAMDEVDKEHVVRYRIYRHSQPITAANLAAAELLAVVPPLSMYNIRGRSVDELIAQVRRKAMEDHDLAKSLAKTRYFQSYNPDMAEMAEVMIRPLAIEDGKPLAAGTGLYVHCPETASTAHYAVLAQVDGVTNTVEFASNVASVQERVGPGEPVLQGPAQVTVFYDYPGQRLQYVQWAAPPLAHLPNQYFNWGVFIPRDYDAAAVRRLSVVFHDVQQRYLKPAWPHRRDTVLLSPHDYPYRSFGYGYHESLGTLKSFQQGAVQPFLGRRVDTMREWAVKRFKADPACVSCGGSGHWGGTAALQYGLRRFGKIAYVLADGSADANPQLTPYTYNPFQPTPGDTKTGRAMMDAVWGKPQWKIKAESGKTIWEEMDLPAYVRAAKTPVPFLTLGAGSLHVTWPGEAALMRAYMESRNGFMAEFFWGSSPFLPLPVTAQEGDSPFEPRAKGPMLACWPKSTGITAKFYEAQFLTGKRGYTSGDRFNTKPRWMPDDIVDTPERLEMTLFSGKVVYAGSETTETTIRNAQHFKPAPGEKLVWSLTALDGKQKSSVRQAFQPDAITVDPHGLITIPKLTFGAPARLVIQREKQR